MPARSNAKFEVAGTFFRDALHLQLELAAGQTSKQTAGKDLQVHVGTIAIDCDEIRPN